MQLIFLESEPEESDFAQFDFPENANPLIGYVNFVRQNLHAIASTMQLERASNKSVDDLNLWADLLNETSTLPLSQFANASTFLKLTAAMACEQRFSRNDRIALLADLLHGHWITPKIRIQVCEKLGVLNSIDCIGPITKACTTPHLYYTASNHFNRLVASLAAEDSNLPGILAKCVEELTRMDLKPFQQLVQPNLDVVQIAMRKIAIDCEGEFLPIQRLCAAILLSRMIGADATEDLLRLFQLSCLQEKEQIIQRLHFEVYDQAEHCVKHGCIVLRQLIECLQIHDPSAIPAYIECLNLDAAIQLVSYSLSKLDLSIELNEIFADMQARLAWIKSNPEPISENLIRLLTPCTMSRISPPHFRLSKE